MKRFGTFVVALGGLLLAADARANLPDGYACGAGGKPALGKGCLCPEGKVSARDKSNDAVCVAVEAPAPVVVVAPKNVARPPAVGPFPPALPLWHTGRAIPLILTEIVLLQQLLVKTPTTSPDYVTITVRLATTYEDLEDASARAALTATGDQRTKSIAASRKARLRVITLDRLVLEKHATYAKIDEVLCRLALEYESRPVFDPADKGEQQAKHDDLDAARAAYQQLVDAQPTSKLVADAYVRLGDRAFDDALQGKSDFKNAADDYRRAATGCASTSCRPAGYATYRLGFALWYLGDAVHAKSAMADAIALAASGADLPQAAAIATDAKKALTEL